MGRDEWLTGNDLDRMIDFLRGRVDPLIARRFGCACVRRVWNKVTQPSEWISQTLIEHCCRAVELTERSLTGPVSDSELREIDFVSITDQAHSAFMAAAHVGWNLFAPVNDLLPVDDEFRHVKEIALLTACAGGPSERQHQLDLLRELVCYPDVV